MSKRLLISAITALALIAAPAQAYAAGVHCDGFAFGQQTITGGNDTFTGVLSGFVASTVGTNDVSIRCYVQVNGGEVSSTPAGSGVGIAGTTGQVTFTATDNDVVGVCSDWTDGGDSGTTCIPWCMICTFTPDGTICTWVPCICLPVPCLGSNTQIPPQEVVDLLVSLQQSFFDPIPCPVLAAFGPFANIPGVIETNGQGDVFLLGEPLQDCPPYDL